MSHLQPLHLLGPLMRALGFLQMIEEGLRLYVGVAEELIQDAVPYGIPFRVDKKLILRASLGRLIDMFAKLNRNDELIARLRQLPEHRNYIAHAAFMRAFDKRTDFEYAKRHATEVGDEAEKILMLIRQEAMSIMVNVPNSEMAKLLSGGEEII